MEILSTVRAEVNRWTRDIIKPSHIYKDRFALPLNPKFWLQSLRVDKLPKLGT